MPEQAPSGDIGDAQEMTLLAMYLVACFKFEVFLRKVLSFIIDFKKKRKYFLRFKSMPMILMHESWSSTFTSDLNLKHDFVIARVVGRPSHHLSEPLLA
ncbi:hypothetical protein OK016_21110 [Vibrio chagasii]|nr:hypothetical protein [Vibrio chagasii]